MLTDQPPPTDGATRRTAFRRRAHPPNGFKRATARQVPRGTPAFHPPALEHETPAPRPETGDPPNRLLTLDEAAKILRVGRTTAWEIVNSGDLSAIRLRGKLLVPCEELERYLGELIEDARASAAARRSVRRKSPILRSARG